MANIPILTRSLPRVFPNGRSRSLREIAYREFNVHESPVFGNPDFPTPSRVLTRVPIDGRFRSTLGVRYFTRLGTFTILYPDDQNSDRGGHATRVPQIERLRSCREIADRDSLVQEFYDSQKPRYADLRLCGIYRHVSCRDQRLGSALGISRTTSPRISDLTKLR
jgi:hypothetical protein